LAALRTALTQLLLLLLLLRTNTLFAMFAMTVVNRRKVPVRQLASVAKRETAATAAAAVTTTILGVLSILHGMYATHRLRTGCCGDCAKDRLLQAERA
jgi:hypothetical protein